MDHMCLLSLCCSLCDFSYIMWSCKSLDVLCIIPFGMLCLSELTMMFVKIMLAVCMLVGMVGIVG